MKIENERGSLEITSTIIAQLVQTACERVGGVKVATSNEKGSLFGKQQVKTPITVTETENNVEVTAEVVLEGNCVIAEAIKEAQVSIADELERQLNLKPAKIHVVAKKMIP